MLDSVRRYLEDLLTVDPLNFVESKLCVDGQPFNLFQSGREYLHEIYRYIAITATSATSLPVVIVKGRQVEMSTTITSLYFYFLASGIFNNIIGLHTFPTIPAARRYSIQKFNTMVEQSINGYLISRKKKKGVFSVSHKQFEDDNALYIDGASNGDRLRNIPGSIAFFDEVQDTDRNAIEIVSESLSHSKIGPPGIGLKVFFGTPKNEGSFFHSLWQKSDQREFFLRCISCNELFAITLDNFKHGFMVTCDFCGTLQDKRLAIARGEWIPRKVDESVEYRGYHINQLLVPIITREAIARKEPPKKTRRSFLNEVLGEFYSGTDVSLTIADIIKYLTTKPDSSLMKIRNFINDKFTYMGIDLGGRLAGEEDSGEGGYSVIVILSEDATTGQLIIEYCYKMETNDVDAQLQTISDLIKRYNCIEVGIDFGFGGHIYVNKLQKDWGERIKSIFSSTYLKVPYKYERDKNMITIDKHVVLEYFFDELEDYTYILPYSEPEKVEWLAEHISGVEIQTKVVGGIIRKTFVKSGDQSIDGLMALNYARVMYLFRKTKEFRYTLSKFGVTGYNLTDNDHNMPIPRGSILTTGSIGKLYARSIQNRAYWKK